MKFCKLYTLTLSLFVIFLRIGPYGSNNFQTLLLRLKIALKLFQTFPESYLNRCSPKKSIALFTGGAGAMLLNTNRKPYMGSPAAPLDLTLSDFERSKI